MTVLATAGHVDHGKSTLVNFLTEQETDRLKDFGYKTNKVGFSLGTNFEYLDNFNTGFSTSTYYENIEANSTASSRQKKLAGNFLDTFLILDLTIKSVQGGVFP